MKPNPLIPTSVRIDEELRAELDREATELGLNLTEYLRAILERRNVERLDSQLLTKNIVLRKENDVLLDKVRQLTYEKLDQETILGPHFRKCIGKRIWISSSQETIIVNSMRDFTVALAALVKLSSEDED